MLSEAGRRAKRTFPRSRSIPTRTTNVRPATYTADFRGRSLAPDMHHGPRRGHEIRLTNVVPFFFLRDHATDELRQFIVRSPPPHLRVQVVIPYREQAGANLSVTGDTNAAAMSAEWMRHGRDDADLANAIFKAVAPCGLRARVRDFHQRPILRH